MQNQCLLCAQKRFSLNSYLKLPAYESILWQDNNVYVAPDLFPIAVGHILISSKEHYNSFGNAPRKTIESVKTALNFLANNVFLRESIAVFEHGAVVEQTAGASISHAHMHVLPIHFDLQSEVVKSPLIVNEPEPCTIDDLYKLGYERQSYIYCQTNRQSSVIFRVNTLPSQFMRYVIATKLGTEYDWKTAIGNRSFINRFHETLKKYGGHYGEID